MYAEQFARVRPHAARLPIGRAGKVAELADRILVGILGVDALSRAEEDAPAPNLDALLFQADEVHFDPSVTRIIDGLVLERIQVEVGAKLAIDARQEIE